MAYTTINDPSEYFNILRYKGNGRAGTVTRPIIGTGFKPDWLWIKNRTSSGGAGENVVFDTTRGNTKDVYTNKNEAEHTNSDVLLSFDADGFTVGRSGTVNERNSNFVAWQWKANGGTTTTNDASATGVGSVDSVYQVNSTSKFGIMTYTATGSGNITVAHGLGSSPKVVFTKVRDQAFNWVVGHHKIASDFSSGASLNSNNAAADNSDAFGDTAPSSTVFTMGNGGNANNNYQSGDDIVAYYFDEVQGFSKFGSYTGNGDADGTFVYTGFKPAWLLIKNTADTADWTMWDATRYPTNPQNIQLYANLNNAEDSPSTSTIIDLLSNGFKLRGTNNKINGSSDKIIYMAFAESPFVTSNETPNNAK